MAARAVAVRAAGACGGHSNEIPVAYTAPTKSAPAKGAGRREARIAESHGHQRERERQRQQDGWPARR